MLWSVLVCLWICVIFCVQSVTLAGRSPDSWRGETPGGPAAVAGRRDVRVGMAGTVVHRAGRDGANQEYLNDEIFSQPLFSPGQLSRTSAAASVGSSKANVKCSLLSLLSPHVARCRHRGADNNNHQPHTFTLLSARNIVIWADLDRSIWFWMKVLGWHLKMALRNPIFCNIG